jgi:cytidine deaminase
MSIDWPVLRAAATAAADRAYAPYSRLRVGAAGLATDGTVVTGCNVENASFGLTLCAECGLVSALHAAGARRLTAVSVVAADGAPLVPCGRCRQLLMEAGGADLLLDADGGPHRLGDLLPDAFTGNDLSVRREDEGGGREDEGGGREDEGGGREDKGGAGDQDAGAAERQAGHA